MKSLSNHVKKAFGEENVSVVETTEQAVAELAKREARRQYYRNWRKNNPDKIKAATDRYWSKKAIEFSEQKQSINPTILVDIPEENDGSDEIYKILCAQLNTPGNNGQRVRKIFGEIYDLGTAEGRLKYAKKIIPLLTYLRPNEREGMTTELTILTGISIKNFLSAFERILF